MADRLLIEASGFAFLSAIEAAANRVEHPRDLMALIGTRLEQSIAQRFTTKTDPAGNAWLPLADSTLAAKKGKGSLLELTGFGKASLVYNAGDDFVEVGFAEAYMAYHEFGTPRMPRRQLLTDDPVAGTLATNDQQDILADITAYLNGLGLT